jgi:hypothetical protein
MKLFLIAVLAEGKTTGLKGNLPSFAKEGIKDKACLPYLR